MHLSICNLNIGNLETAGDYKTSGRELKRNNEVFIIPLFHYSSPENLIIPLFSKNQGHYSIIPLQKFPLFLFHYSSSPPDSGAHGTLRRTREYQTMSSATMVISVWGFYNLTNWINKIKQWLWVPVWLRDHPVNIDKPPVIRLCRPPLVNTVTCSQASGSKEPHWEYSIKSSSSWRTRQACLIESKLHFRYVSN